MEVIRRPREHSWGKQITPLLTAPPALSIHFVAYLVAHRSTARSPRCGLQLCLGGQEGRESNVPVGHPKFWRPIKEPGYQ